MRISAALLLPVLGACADPCERSGEHDLFLLRSGFLGGDSDALCPRSLAGKVTFLSDDKAGIRLDSGFSGTCTIEESDFECSANVICRPCNSEGACIEVSTGGNFKEGLQVVGTSGFIISTIPGRTCRAPYHASLAVVKR